MRNNQPITQREFIFADDATLMSTTDLNSHITYANDAFIEVSGFEPGKSTVNRITWCVTRICRRKRLPTCGPR